MRLTNDRRYSEDEVAQILEAATASPEAGERVLPPGEGVTLAELQDIAREVGIPEASIELAASRLDSPGPTASPASKFLGMPIAVGRIVHLDREVSDREWDIFVADLRETFDARGKLRQDGSLRQWTNGNLQALLEPTPSGDRLRLKTVKGNARTLFTGAVISMLGAASVGLSSLGASGGLSIRGMLGVLTLLGGLFLGSRWLRLPKWAATRERQMEAVADRLVASLSTADAADEGAQD